MIYNSVAYHQGIAICNFKKLVLIDSYSPFCLTHQTSHTAETCAHRYKWLVQFVHLVQLLQSHAIIREKFPRAKIFILDNLLSWSFFWKTYALKEWKISAWYSIWFAVWIKFIQRKGIEIKGKKTQK